MNEGWLADRPTQQHQPIIFPEVCHVGEIVAVVVAASVAAAKDAAELVEIDWQVLPAIARGLDAAEDGAPRARLGRPNIILDGEAGDEGNLEGVCPRDARRRAYHLGAAHRRRADGAARGGQRIRPGDEAAHLPRRRGRRGQARRDLAMVFGIPLERARMVMHDIGGNFGTRGSFNAVFALVVWGAKTLSRSQVDLRPPGVFCRRLPGARPLVPRRAGARRRGKLPRDARLEPRQPGRLCNRLRLAQQRR